MKKYLTVLKTTFNDSIQYASSYLFRFIGFAITLSILSSLWAFIYKDASNTINGYTYSQMIWYLLLAEMITFGSGSKVATDEIRDCIKSGNIAYQINKPYNYIIYIIFKYLADTFIIFFLFMIVAIILGMIVAGPIPNFNPITIIPSIPIFFFAILITGLTKILISLTSFWVEDSKPFQHVYNKFILIFGVFFPIEMFPPLIANILRFTPIYSVSYGPAKIIIDFNINTFQNIIISQIITIIIISIIISIIYGRGVKKLNVNGG